MRCHAYTSYILYYYALFLIAKLLVEQFKPGMIVANKFTIKIDGIQNIFTLHGEVGALLGVES